MGDLDRIGGLPDHIISHILSFIPTKEAIRTSVLSSSWRYRFASMSTFDFLEDRLARGQNMKIDNNFKMFVDRLLSFPNPSTVDCFRLYNHPGNVEYCCSHHSADDGLRVYRWISAVLSRGVKELVLIRLISSCDVLQELELTATDQLGLSDIIIKNPSLKRLVLDVGERDNIHLVEINAPNLVYFYYDDDLADRYVLSDMKFLEIAYIQIYVFKGRDPPSLLQTICNVQSLRINVNLSTELSQTALAFNNLVELELESACGEWLVKFLHRAPNLKTLIMPHVGDDVLRFIPEEVPSCLSFHLKEIRFSVNYTNERMLQTISYFLNHALVLEKLRIRVYELYSKEDSSMLNKLLRLLEISIDKLQESGIMKKLLRLPGSRTIDVSVVKS